jgi:hemerythrin-like domain-containing protein
MKSVTATLLEEHELVARAAACLERLADEARVTDDLCIVTAIDLLEFFQDFVDGAHQTKEERHLFPALIEGGMARNVVRELLEDHRYEREAMSALFANLEGAASGDTESCDKFVNAALEFAAAQREHAAEEDCILLPLVERYLDERLEQKVQAGFREVDERMLRRRYEAYGTIVDDVETRMASTLWNWSRGAGFLELVPSS